MRRATLSLTLVASVACSSSDDPVAALADTSLDDASAVLDDASAVLDEDAPTEEDVSSDEDAETGDDTETGDDADAEIPFTANAGASVRGVVGETITLDGSASSGAVSYEWYFGDGAGSSDPSDNPVATVTYDQPGRYQAVLTIRNALGQKRTDGVVVSITHPAVHTPRHSSTVLAVTQDPPSFVAVNRDGGTLTYTIRDGDAWTTNRWNVCSEPTSLARHDDGTIGIVCRADGTLQVRSGDFGSVLQTIPLTVRSRPFGVIAAPDGWYVSYESTGEVAHVVDGAVATVWPVVADGRHLARLPDGRVAVSRLRSPKAQGEIGVLDPSDGTVTTVPLAFDDQLASDTEIGGVPNYLGPMLVSPTGMEAALPSLQANVQHGAWVNDTPFRPDTQVRAIVSWLTLEPGIVERPEERKQFDSRGLTMAGAFSEFGDYIYLAMRGSRAIERFDVLTQTQAGVVLDVGYAPDGLALAGEVLAIDATLSRELVLLNVGDHQSDPVEVARIPTVDAEPLSPVLLLGKQLFNDSYDDRLSKDGYMACAHCHLDGDTDNRVWDFTDRGEGLRNTISMLGRAGMGDGPVHWSANFDEIQDFEHDIRGPFGGDGLTDDAVFEASGGTLDTPLTGTSDALDAMAAYVASLAVAWPSPHTEPDGTLSADALAGQAIFTSDETGCATCHTGDRYTDSGWDAPGVPRLHDVGTLQASSGQRMGGPLLGIDTPTLRGLWGSAPYLHDGSAATLLDVLTTKNPLDQHGKTSHLTAAELAQLVEFLRSL